MPGKRKDPKTLAEDTFVNPLQENEQIKSADPCIVVIFGATGDLTGRKLVPALYNMKLEGQLPSNFVCVGFARRDKSHDDFRKEMDEKIHEFSRTQPVDKATLDPFLNQLYYHRSEFQDEEGYKNLSNFLNELDAKHGTKGNRIYYLSVQPTYFSLVVEELYKAGLIYDSNKVKDRFSRVIIEKPFGHNLESAKALQSELLQFLKEDQIFRIDHYLGKETVQNLLVFRFANAIFEGLWNSRYVDNVQITVAESIGIEGRGAFYEEAGLLRDILQNHMMQLVSLVAMEPPSSLSAEAVRDEKVKVVEAIRPYTPDDFVHSVVRGQYDKGYIEGEEAIAYRDEEKVDNASNRETFGALRLFIDNWRWAGVPFYLRAGKRLPKRVTEIAVTFKKVPDILFFKNDPKFNVANSLIFRIQPDEGISVVMASKIPGQSYLINPVKMDFQYKSYYGKEVPEAYERLIFDCMLGDSTLFARFDESLNSWNFFSPILDHWANKKLKKEDFYPSGTWGPKAADALIKRDNRTWKAV